MTEESRSPRRRVAWVGAGAVVVVAVAVVVVSRGGGDDGGCLTGLAGHVPVDAELVAGSDLDRARDAGLDIDGSVGDGGEAIVDTGVQLDPLSHQRMAYLDDSTESTGYAVRDVRCWVGEGLQSFVARGSFDREAVTTSEAGGGKSVVRGDILALDADDSPAALLDAPSDGAPQAELVEAFDRHGAVTFAAMSIPASEDGIWAGVGLARGDVWELLAVWAFPNAEAARDGRARVLAGVQDGDVPSMVAGDADDLLRQDGATLWLRAPLKVDVFNWIVPLRQFDPMFSLHAP